MPKYFFHVLDGRMAVDTVGLVIDTESDLRKEALRAASEMIPDGDTSLWSGHAWRMPVTDEDGYVVFTMEFSIEQPTKPAANVIRAEFAKR